MTTRLLPKLKNCNTSLFTKIQKPNQQYLDLKTFY